MKETYQVTGMTCTACSSHVEKAVGKVAGVRSVSVNLMTGSMLVDYDQTAAAPADIVKAVVDAGYGASLPSAAKTARRERAEPRDALAEELRQMKVRLILSFCFLIPLFYLSMGHMMGWPLPAVFHGRENAMLFALTQFLLVLPILYINDKYYKVGFKTLWKRAPNMDSLIALGSAAAVLYGVAALYQIAWGLGHGDAARVDKWSMDLYLESAGMILTLITLGKFLETRSKGKTGQAISRLMDLSPKTATVLRDGAEVEVPVEEVAVGERIVVKPGGRVPVDGVVVEGFDNTPIKFAKCCSPLPGDPIVGFITRGFGVSIHKQSCANAVSSMKDPSNAPRWVKAYWADSVKDSYKAGLEIIALNRNELLSDVLAALADIRVPIYAMNARQVENNCAVISLTIGINNTEHLNRVVARLSKVKDVLKVTRS
mgnify:CR=1 FL=1